MDVKGIFDCLDDSSSLFRFGLVIRLNFGGGSATRSDLGHGAQEQELALTARPACGARPPVVTVSH